MSEIEFNRSPQGGNKMPWMCQDMMADHPPAGQKNLINAYQSCSVSCCGRCIFMALHRLWSANCNSILVRPCVLTLKMHIFWHCPLVKAHWKKCDPHRKNKPRTPISFSFPFLLGAQDFCKGVHRKYFRFAVHMISV